MDRMTSGGSPNQNGDFGSTWVAWARRASLRTSAKAEMSIEVVTRGVGASSHRFRHSASKGDSRPSSSNFWWISRKRATENSV